MIISRRKFLKLLAVGASTCLTLISPLTSWAAWANDAFNADTLNKAYQHLFGSSTLINSNEVKLKAPKTAENSDAVPISIKTKLKGVDSISIFVQDNPQPLTATFQIPPDTLASVSTRIRLVKTSTVIAVIKAGDKLYSRSQKVKVSSSGCTR
ncbi:thiosulfate oxidation carrier protein SoxY [Cycloclasticus pugetii]|uniref:thiosulfate oxidation carrier protein SoxY n=1 Tax=Cycloclasticus pugetii TaxID=34068 RepID=UPI00038167FE|nr:thiosulfate oxidation carrier protein SoxY [Cycloclasticus pugetii]